MQSIELFTGAGGLALGVHQAGFHHAAVVEYNRNACDTLRLNSQRAPVTGVAWPVTEADVRAVSYTPYAPLPLDLLAGGAPCQPFSLGGKHRGSADTRNMFPEVFRAVRALWPRAILLENVRGLTRTSFRAYFDYLIAQLTLPLLAPRPEEPWEDHAARLRAALASGAAADARHRYDVAWRVFNTADFGVPQERHRVFIVAFRHDLGAAWSFPTPTHSADALLYAQYVSGSYWQEHGLSPRPTPERLRARVAALAMLPPTEQRWTTVRDALADLPEPIDYDPHPPIADHSGIPDARVYPGHTGSPWDWPAKTIKAGDHGNPGGENMLRRDDGSVRYFTVRELARLQTFPDTWHFAGSWTESRRQLGNAVPVTMATILAHQIRATLDRVHQTHPLLPAPETVPA